MSKLKFKPHKAKIIAVGGCSCYGVFLYKSDYDKALKYIHGDYRYHWFEDVKEAYEWAIVTFMAFNPDTCCDFEYYQLEDLLRKHIAFPYSERVRELGGPVISGHNLLET